MCRHWLHVCNTCEQTTQVLNTRKELNMRVCKVWLSSHFNSPACNNVQLASVKLHLSGTVIWPRRPFLHYLYALQNVGSLLTHHVVVFCWEFEQSFSSLGPKAMLYNLLSLLIYIHFMGLRCLLSQPLQPLVPTWVASTVKRLPIFTKKLCMVVISAALC